MKSTLLLLCFCLPTIAVVQAPTIPTKLFDVRNGNGVVDGGTTYTAAIVIPFGTVGGRTAIQNKNAFLDAFADANSYSATLPDGTANITKQQFFIRALTDYMRTNYKAGVVNTAASAAGKTAGDVVDAEVP